MPLLIPGKSLINFNFAYRSFWLFFAKIIPTITLLAITILYSRELSLTDYGQYQSVWMYINVIVIILNFGAFQLVLSTNFKSFVEFLAANKSKISFFYFALLLCIAFVFLFSSQSLTAYTQYTVLVFIIFQVAVLFFESVLINIKREKQVFLTNTFYSILFFTWHLYLLETAYDLYMLMKGVLAIGVVRLIIFWALSRRHLFLNNEMPISLRHWFFIGINDVVNVITRWLDKLLLIYFLQPAEFAIFFNGSIEIPLFGILVSVIGSILLVDISTHLKFKSRVIDLYRNTFLLTSHIVFPVFWFLAFYKVEIFQILFKGKYNASIEIFMFSLLVIPLRITNYSAILQCYNKANLILKGSILDIITALLLMPLLYYILGLKGVALAIVISTYIQAYYYLHYSSRILNTTISKLVPFFTLLKRCITSMLLIALLYFFIANLTEILRLTIAVCFTSLLILFNLALAYKLELRKLKNSIG